MDEQPAVLLVTSNKVVWKKEDTDRLVLGTVNAPCRHSMDAVELARCLIGSDIRPPQVLELFMNVEPELLFEFSRQHRIPPTAIILAYRQIRAEGWNPRSRMTEAMDRLQAIQVFSG